jgi:hypothetical protein
MITIKRFATKALTGNATAAGFISTHRDFLDQQEVVRPILAAYDRQEVPADIILCQLQSLLVSHMLQLEINKAKAKMDRGARVSAVPAKYEVKLYVMQYDKQEQMTVVHLPEDKWKANDFGEAQGLADRRLFTRQDSLYAEIINTQGKPIITHVQRQDAICRTLRAKKGPFCKKMGSASSSLKWYAKAKQSHCSFSRG